MIADLPMYLFPETRAAHDAFWAGVRDNLRAGGIRAPEHMAHEGAPEAVWGHPELALSHICNLPYRLHFRGRVTRIAASDYALEGCAPGQYRALFVVREDHPARAPEELEGSAMAYSDAESHSGWGSAALWAIDRGLRFRPTLRTGAHENSLRAVVARQADFATIDARTFEVLKARMAETRSVRVVGATDPSPGMTFITRAGQDPAPYRDALAAALAALEDRHREVLGLRGFPVLPEEAYAIPLPPHPEHWRH